MVSISLSGVAPSDLILSDITYIKPSDRLDLQFPNMNAMQPPNIPGFFLPDIPDMPIPDLNMPSIQHPKSLRIEQPDIPPLQMPDIGELDIKMPTVVVAESLNATTTTEPASTTTSESILYLDALGELVIDDLLQSQLPEAPANQLNVSAVTQEVLETLPNTTEVPETLPNTTEVPETIPNTPKPETVRSTPKPETVPNRPTPKPETVPNRPTPKPETVPNRLTPKPETVRSTPKAETVRSTPKPETVRSTPKPETVRSTPKTVQNIQPETVRKTTHPATVPTQPTPKWVRNILQPETVRNTPKTVPNRPQPETVRSRPTPKTVRGPHAPHPDTVRSKPKIVRNRLPSKTRSHKYLTTHEISPTSSLGPRGEIHRLEKPAAKSPADCAPSETTVTSGECTSARSGPANLTIGLVAGMSILIIVVFLLLFFLRRRPNSKHDFPPSCGTPGRTVPRRALPRCQVEPNLYSIPVQISPAARTVHVDESDHYEKVDEYWRQGSLYKGAGLPRIHTTLGYQHERGPRPGKKAHQVVGRGHSTRI